VAEKKHLRLTIFGDYTPSSEDAPEVWACNLRQVLNFGSTDPMDTFPDNWSVIGASSSHTETDWDTVTNYTIDGPLTNSFDPESYLTDYVMPTLGTWSTQNAFSNHVRTLGAALYPCDTTGNAIDYSVARGTFHTPLLGNGSAKMLPTENSLVSSWTTGRNGPRGRGRIFPPPITTDVIDSYGQVDTSSADTYMAIAVDLIEGLAFHGVGTDGAVVQTVVTGPATSAGMGRYSSYAVITGCRVGLVVDTQRRRRNKLPEKYRHTTVSQ
jgi:hypothetical protein